MKTENSASAREVNKFRKLAKEVIKHHFGTTAKRIEHKSAGLTNFVFAFKHSEGDFIIRISPDPTRINSFIERAMGGNCCPKSRCARSGNSGGRLRSNPVSLYDLKNRHGRRRDESPETV